MDYRTYVRVTHIPTGICAACNHDRSQHRNKATALAIVTARLYAMSHVERVEDVVRSYEWLEGTEDVVSVG